MIIHAFSRYIFNFTYTSATNPSDYLVELTNDTNNPAVAGCFLGVGMGISGNTLAITYSRLPHVAAFSSSTIPVSANTTYYVTMERVNPTFAKLSAFSDATRTNQIPGSPIYQVIPSGITGLSTVETGNDQLGCTCRSLTAYVDNTVITSPEKNGYFS